MRRQTVFLSVILFLASCETLHEQDYRDSFEGSFQFTRVHQVITMCYQPSPTCVDGWTTIHTDTSTIVSEVIASETNRIRIEFGPESTPGHEMLETIFPILYENGELGLPEHLVGGHNSFEGAFVGLDTIKIILRYSDLIGGYDQYDVLGVRVD